MTTGLQNLKKSLDNFLIENEGNDLSDIENIKKLNVIEEHNS